jgi:hypothetical protein
MWYNTTTLSYYDVHLAAAKKNVPDRTFRTIQDTTNI